MNRALFGIWERAHLGKIMPSHAVIIASMDLDPEEIRKVAAPGSKILAYTNTVAIRIKEQPGSNYAQQYAVMGVQKDWWFLDSDGNRIRNEKDTTELLSHNDLLSAKTWAAWAGHTFRRGSGWDGVYMDQCWLYYPRWAKDRIPPGWTTMIDDLWTHWRDYKVQQLRDHLGNDQTILCNVGSTEDSVLEEGFLVEADGISIEHPTERDLELLANKVNRRGRAVMNLNVAWYSPVNFPGICLAGDVM